MTSRAGIFLLLDGDGEVRRVYDDTLALIVAAEELGFSSAWVAQHHFGERYGRLPSPLLFLVAAAERTSRIRLGTAVVTLPFEHPLRLAEDAAVADLLTAGRLELGVGSGYDPAEFAGFGLDPAERHARTDETAAVLGAALCGDPVGASGARVTPRSPALADRLWRAVGSTGSATWAGRRGWGILVGRVERGSEPTPVVQSRFAGAYRESRGANGGVARIAAARTVYPARDAAAARRELDEGVALYASELIRKGYLPPGLAREEYFARLHVISGDPDDVAAALRAEHSAIRWSDLLCQVNPGGLDRVLALRALERIARDVLPRVRDESLVGSAACC